MICNWCDEEIKLNIYYVALVVNDKIAARFCSMLCLESHLNEVEIRLKKEKKK